MATAGPADIILDTSTLINCLRIGRVDLLAGLSGHRFIVTDHVRHEVTAIYPAKLLQPRIRLSFWSPSCDEC